ncbi:PREDICTED: zinc finger protein 354A isoform X5 [Papilio xuthus]|uniref:Zinc finger protein 354A isoform X5 n=1 Tax=Papilio xuthus TaxID=66420 RepID=A0AAJ6Z285_PAPXU|nr:PREDICTED: zinc finger protein 354A isoform X5 [Papilio xuthus]XP_013163612.1 PREDICTED: zinc finger protein 354A isoform X5 [Papilio xuthus]
MEAKTSEWRPGPTVCRCCLTEGCYKDISTEYFWMGKREVYAEMLADTLNLTIAYSQSGGPNSNSRLICEPCISRLRDAADFKRQVQECEKTFLQHLDPSTSGIVAEDVSRESILKGKQVKIELVKLEKDSDDDDFEPSRFTDDDDVDDDIDDQPLTKLAKTPKKETVDLLDLIDNAKVAEKRKSTTKVKATPVKKAKQKKDTKATANQDKPEKKKKGCEEQVGRKGNVKLKSNEQRYARSARAEARIATKGNAKALLECWSLCPFTWHWSRFKCAYCEEGFLQCAELRAHVTECAPKHSFKDIYSNYKEMSLINVDVSEATCRVCSCSYSNVVHMRQHAIQHGYHLDSAQPDGVLPFRLDKEDWRCVICREPFNNFLKLYEHMNVHYQHYICATCGKGYMTAMRLRKHSEVHVTGSFPCDKCARVFTMRAARDHHKAQAHAKGPRYGCPHCNIRFKTYYHRMNHLNEAHKEKLVLYKCNVCELTFSTSAKRGAHVRSVHLPQQRTFPCAHCDWLFKNKSDLKKHMVKHTGERNYSCIVCGKSYPRNKTLRMHLRSHEDLTCKLCGSLFKQRSQLVDHASIHQPDLNELNALGSNKITT